MLAALTGCSSGDKLSPRPLTLASSAPSSLPEPSPVPVLPSSPPERAAADAPFVRTVQRYGGDGVDECLQVGGNYFSCSSAYADEADPVVKRYLWRISQGHAAGVSTYTASSEEESPPHAEVPGMCDLKRPCNAQEGTAEYNKPWNCLALAATATTVAEAKAAHAFACRCHGKGPHFIGYNSTAFICDEQGKPAFLAPKMSDAEGADILACASCDAAKGPEACKREVARLESTDAELSRHIATKHVPRCQTPVAEPD
jgi:hypothetical protein